ncbi:helix-turn-helix transcriptional regulator [Spirosoma rhododendri]|uniref:Helix-turn-helix transcriptional regulator n=1 Tax=Spirosoma rhododendri TaxID=2728024 RepID=A0A7L5DNG2_9BACT|nr:helix-turn-helix transcriptional regulator [Spirosoma rhododendri]QJD80024.1 helix-turn-helix transcriptional regulator [Spirosoma rhododendri]
MNINDKIKQILIDRNFSPSYFADEIGVQRSSISHILSGRNRPSFDIIQKIIRRFPDLGYDWIMEDEQQNSSPAPTSQGAYRQGSTQPAAERYNMGYSNAPNQPVQSSIPRSRPRELAPPQPEMPAEEDFPMEDSGAEKRVERILLFYTDGSFREFLPSV